MEKAKERLDYLKRNWPSIITLITCSMPPISDREYDLPMQELLALEEKYPERLLPDSQPAGGENLQVFCPGNPSQFLSLANAFHSEICGLSEFRQPASGDGICGGTQD